MKKRLLLGVLISALVIIGFTSCNQPSSPQTVLYPPVIKDFKLVDGSVNSDTVDDALPAKKIKYEKEIKRTCIYTFIFNNYMFSWRNCWSNGQKKWNK